MLSYQHSYHAGNLADVHKHAALAAALSYLAAKPKPLSYIETHAGRGLYDLASADARKTGEADAGIRRAEDLLAPDHPLRHALATTRATHGPEAYPGSPLIAQALLRPGDRLHLAELHPGEHALLRQAARAPNTTIYRSDGLALALSLSPPVPRRGLVLIDPSWEVKSDYATLPRQMSQIARAWNVACLMLWYPLLASRAHEPMLADLARRFPDSLRHELRFAPARPGHGMSGSGLFVVKAPYGLDRALSDLEPVFARLAPRR